MVEECLRIEPTIDAESAYRLLCYKKLIFDEHIDFRGQRPERGQAVIGRDGTQAEKENFMAWKVRAALERR